MSSDGGERRRLLRSAEEEGMPGSCAAGSCSIAAWEQDPSQEVHGARCSPAPPRRAESKSGVNAGAHGVDSVLLGCGMEEEARAPSPAGPSPLVRPGQ